jgi:hypothetical protein
MAPEVTPKRTIYNTILATPQHLNTNHFSGKLILTIVLTNSQDAPFKNSDVYLFCIPIQYIKNFSARSLYKSELTALDLVGRAVQ